MTRIRRFSLMLWLQGLTPCAHGHAKPPFAFAIRQARAHTARFACTGATRTLSDLTLVRRRRYHAAQSQENGCVGHSGRKANHDISSLER